MISVRLTKRHPRMLIALICSLHIPLTVFGAKPTTRPATQPSEAGGNPAKELQAALPTGWSLWGSALVGRTLMHPGAQWSRVPAGYVKLRSPVVRTTHGLQRATPPIIVWLVHEKPERESWKPGNKNKKIEQMPTEHLGRGAKYHIYVHVPPEAEARWPTAKRDITKALGKKTATTQPAETVQKQAVIMISQIGGTVSYTVDGVECGDLKALRAALSKVPKDFRLSIQIETNISAGQVARVMAVARKLHLMKISITVVRTSRPPVKPEKRLPL
jgi:biopolymer transport protein ExbD